MHYLLSVIPKDYLSPFASLSPMIPSPVLSRQINYLLGVMVVYDLSGLPGIQHGRILRVVPDDLCVLMQVHPTRTFRWLPARHAATQGMIVIVLMTRQVTCNIYKDGEIRDIIECSDVSIWVYLPWPTITAGVCVIWYIFNSSSSKKSTHSVKDNPCVVYLNHDSVIIGRDQIRSSIVDASK